MSTLEPDPGTDHAAPAARRDRTHFLYVAVIVAVVLGILVGILFPDFATSLKWIGDTFVALVKMMIQPVIFCTLVIGVGSVRSAAS
ncbi:MAG: dctA, partial [Marmoricola sp.]|nr:dctA [Marmoricola sp.]